MRMVFFFLMFLIGGAMAAPDFGPQRGSNSVLPSQFTPPQAIPKGTGPIHISTHPGGLVREFDAWAKELRTSGRKIVLSGALSSANGVLMTLPREQVCAKPGTVFRLHAARNVSTGTVNHHATEVILNTYPRQVQEYVRQRGGITENWLVVPASLVFDVCR